MPGKPIFVYGTLRRGERAHARLAGAPFLGEARTQAGYALIDLGAYPGLVRAVSGQVVGEIYEIDASRLVELDAYEGHPALFRRVELELDGSDGGRPARAEGYLYMGDPEDGIRLEGGDWRGRVPSRG